MTQKDKIIHFLNRYESITQRDALSLGIYRLASRINDMKRDGIPIKTDMRKVVNADGTTSTIAVYSYDSRPASDN
jgi:hypothetical protein